MPWGSLPLIDRNGLKPTPLHASPNLPVTIPTMLRGAQGIVTAVC
jgi:hypothetical protein